MRTRFSDLILNNSNALSMLCSKNMVEERRLQEPEIGKFKILDL